MTWLFFALLAPALFALINYIDKYLLGKFMSDYNGILAYTGITGFVMGCIFWIVGGFPILSLRDAAIVISTGIITIWSLYIYFKALSEEETSIIIILFQAIPVFVLILSYLFLKEFISSSQLLGFVVIISVSTLVSLQTEGKGNKFKFTFSKSLFLILIYDLMTAGASILIKFALHVNSFVHVISYEGWGIGIGALVLYIIFPSIRRSFLKTITTLPKKALIILFGNEIVYVAARSSMFFAFSIGPLALVRVLSSTQVFFGLIYGWILTLIAPKIFKEDISTKGIIKKVIAVIILFFGIWLVYR